MCTHTCMFDLLVPIMRSTGEICQSDKEDEKASRGQGKSKFYNKHSVINLTPTSLSVFWVTASWSEVNYSKRQRVLASARYHQENHQLCRRRFLISLTHSSAPETVALTHLIEAHLALDLTIWAQVSGGISSSEALNEVSVRRLSRYMHLLQAEVKKFDFYLYPQLRGEQNHIKQISISFFTQYCKTQF